MTRVALLSAVLAVSLAGCGLSTGTAATGTAGDNTSASSSDVDWYGVQDLQANADGTKPDPALLRQKAFDAMDADKDGAISLAEFTSFKPPAGPGGPQGGPHGGPGMGPPPPPGGEQLTDAQKADLEAMHKELAAKRQELEQAFLQKYPEIEAKRAQEQQKAFDGMDTDKNGSLSLTELKPPPGKGGPGGPGGPGGHQGPGGKMGPGGHGHMSPDSFGQK